MEFDTSGFEAGTRHGLRTLPIWKKLWAVLVFSVTASLLSQPLPALGACIFAGALLVCSGLSLSFAAKRLITVNAFFLFLWLLLPLSFSPTSDSGAVIRLGPLFLHASGVSLALLITLKGNAIVAALLALAGTSTISENGHALLRLGVPQKLVALLLVTHGSLSHMAREYQRGFQAAKLRGFAPATDMASYKTIAGLIGLLLVRSWQRAQRVEIAMRLRGFCGRFPLIAPQEVKKEKKGTAVLCLCCLAAFALAAWDYHV